MKVLTRKTKNKLLNKFGGQEVSARKNRSVTIQFTKKEKVKFDNFYNKAVKYGGKLKWLKKFHVYSTGCLDRINIDY